MRSRSLRPADRHLGALACFLLAGFLVYSNTFLAPFHLDDARSIVTNAVIRDIHGVRAVWDYWPSRFVTYLTFALNYSLGGLSVFGYHLVNLLVHIAAALAVRWLVLQACVRRPEEGDELTAFFAGLLFLVHPVQTQGVTYIVQRTTSLCALLYLVSVCLYASARSRERAGRRWKPAYAGALAAAVAAMFTKEMAFTLPLVILLFDGCVEGKVSWKRAWPFLVLLPLVPLTMALTGSVDLLHLRRTVETGPGIQPLDYICTQFRVCMTYLRLLVAPFGQNLDYDYPLLGPGRGLGLALACAGAVAACVAAGIAALRRGHRLIGFGILWFFVTLAAESLIPVKDVIFEHRLYLPLAGFALCAGAALHSLSKNGLLRSRVRVAAVVCVCALAVVAFNRNQVWKDELTLADDTVRKSPGKPRAYLNRGFIHSEREEYAAASADFGKALGICYRTFGMKASPPELPAAGTVDWSPVFEMYGERFAELSLPGIAVPFFIKAVNLNPANERAWVNLAGAYGSSGDFRRAVEVSREAIAKGHDTAMVRHNLAVAYFYLGRRDLALEQEDKARALGSVDPRFRQMLESGGAGE